MKANETKAEYNKKLEKSIELYKSGLNIKNAAITANVSESSLQKALKKLNLSRTNKKDISKKLEKAIEIYKSGSTIEVSAKSASVIRQALRKELKRLGLNRTIWRKTTPEKLEKAIELYKSGLTIKESATIVDISNVPLQKAIKKLGLIRVNNISEKLEKAIKFYESGLSVNKSAKKANISKNILGKTIKKLGITISRNKTTPEKLEKAIEFYKSGLIADDAAKKVNINKTKLQKELKKLGLTRKRSRPTKSTPEKLEKAIELYKSGSTIVEVAKTVDINRGKLQQLLKKLNITRIQPIKTTPEKLEKAVKLYKSGLSIINSAKTADVGQCKLSKTLKKLNITRTQFKPENLEKAIELYKSGICLVESSKLANIGQSTLQINLKKLGLTRSNKINSRKYYVNHSYFDQINTEEKAYWLGFIYADGYVTEDKYSKHVGIALHVKDTSHLEKFTKALDSNYPVKEIIGKHGWKEEPYPCCRVIINSEQMFDSLLKHGCFKNKSLILKYPSAESLPNHLNRHFIRGMLDGDGSFAKATEGFSIKFCGTKDILESILKIFKKENIKLGKRHEDDKNTYDFTIGGRKQVRYLAAYMYANATIYLDRKKERYDLIRNWKKPERKTQMPV